MESLCGSRDAFQHLQRMLHRRFDSRASRRIGGEALDGLQVPVLNALAKRLNHAGAAETDANIRVSKFVDDYLQVGGDKVRCALGHKAKLLHRVYTPLGQDTLQIR